jgi:Holliday junction DNA helicase RuvA
MIASIKGKITLIKDKFLIIEKEGIGYKVFLSPSNLEHFNEEDKVFLYIHTHIKEDAMDLYGFLDYEELEFFETLITISGIGPKGALGILSIADINTLKKAISSNDITYLTRISGIGKKTAQKIVLELKDKIGKMAEDNSLQKDLDVLEALLALGYKQVQIREVLKEIDESLDTNSKIREALKLLGNK